MFTKSIKTLAALIISLFALSSLASAQYGLPDFTDIDIDALLDKVDQQKTAAVNAIIGGIIEDTWRDSQVSFSYQQFVERSKCTSRQQFAYLYGATAGFTAPGLKFFKYHLLYSYGTLSGIEMDWEPVVVGIKFRLENAKYGPDGSIIWETLPPTGAILSESELEYVESHLNDQLGHINYDPMSGLYFQHNSNDYRSDGYLFSCDGDNFVSLDLLQME